MAPGWELDFKTFFHRVMIPDPALSHEDVIFEEGGTCVDCVQPAAAFR
jgi:hypothetical protein